MSDDLDLYAPEFNLHVRCSCGAETIVVWDTGELDYVPLDPTWQRSPTALYSCGSAGNYQRSSEQIALGKRNALRPL